MIELPDHWQLLPQGKRLNLKTLIPASMSASDRARLRKSLCRASLTHQLTTSDIPSLNTTEYRCQAILFLDIQLTELRFSDFAARMIQPLLKEHAVLCFHEGGPQFCLSYAHKRLSLVDPNEIVITDAYCSRPLLYADLPIPLRQNALVNLLDKRQHYLEAMVKHFTLDHSQLFIGALELLKSNVWYHGDSTLELLRSLMKLRDLKKQKDKATSQKQMLTTNAEIKKTIDSIRVQYLK